jgi:hypothetical protein
MVGIDGEDDPEKVRRFVEEYDIESPAVYQPDLGYSTTYVLGGDTRWSAPTRGGPLG